MQRLALLPVVALVALVAPSTALAHGIHGEAQTIAEYVWLGIRHMVGGWDHLLFIAGIVLLARTFVQAAKLISLFVAGHSLTLLVATLAGWTLDAEAVDVVIALSVAYIGWRNLRGRPADWRWTHAAIFGFGLVHGLGLSTRLQELTLPGGGALVARILAFNVGVEIGQLLALTAIVAAALLVLRLRPAARAHARHAAAGLVALGLLAAGVFSFLALRPGSETTAAGTASAETAAAGAGTPIESRTCREEPYTPEQSAASLGGHLDRAFFEPGDEYRSADLQHVLGDGYLIVVYDRDLPEARRAELKAWVTAGQATVGVPGPSSMTEATETLTYRTRFVCEELELDALDAFRVRWFTGG